MLSLPFPPFPLPSDPAVHAIADPADLVAALTVTRLDTVWSDDPRLQDGPDLPARLRGAWGAALVRRAAAGDVEAATARALFFPDKLAGPGFAGAAPPYRLAVERSGGTLLVALLLIGFAGRWREVAFDALIEALAEPPGLWLDRAGERMARLRLLQADWTRREGVAVPDTPARVMLDFVTPLRIGPSDALGTAFGDVIVGLADRAARIGPWLGLTFSPRLSHWRDIAKTVRFDARGLRPVMWDMHSTQNGRDRAAGYIGPLRLTVASPELMALLAAGTVLHAGRSPAKGCGRYELLPD